MLQRTIVFVLVVLLFAPGCREGDEPPPQFNQAMDAGGRVLEPEKIISSVRLPLRRLKDCSPNTQRNASAMLDFPDPFGPTTAVIVGAKAKLFLLANVL